MGGLTFGGYTAGIMESSRQSMVWLERKVETESEYEMILFIALEEEREKSHAGDA